MELKLKKREHLYYDLELFPPFSSEITKESIVPDSCADIARIVETTGYLCVTGREVAGDGRFCASGTLNISVLYAAERGEGARSLHIQIPFQCYSEGHGELDAEFTDVFGELQMVETRLLNPRKVLTRANMVFYPKAYQRVKVDIAEEVLDCPQIQTLCQERQSRVVAGVCEKEFSFTEELPLSPGKVGADEMISSRIQLRSTDCKLIGNKLVIKGIANVTILYREEQGRLATLEQELPFSQILDGNSAEEEWEKAVETTLLGFRCRVGSNASPDDPHIFTVDVELRARVTLWNSCPIRMITDLYSIQGETRCASAELDIHEDHQRYTRRQNVRELLETGSAVKSVVDTEVICGAVRCPDERDELSMDVLARCLYLDESDVLRGVCRTFPVSCQIQKGQQARILGEAAIQEVMANILPEGIEIRFPVEWSVEQTTTRHCRSINSVELTDEEDRPETPPSLILRRAGEQENLWSLAKQYRTTCQAIMAVNDLAPDQKLPEDRLLLIPKAK